jgi:hypothetical protein
VRESTAANQQRFGQAVTAENDERERRRRTAKKAAAKKCAARA